MIFPASIPLYLLSKESKRLATVMLAGEGADEILAGYDSNVRADRLARFASGIPAPARRLLAHLPLPGRAGAIAARAALDETGVIVSGFRLGGHLGIAEGCRIPMPAADDDDRQLLEEIGFPARDGTFLDRLLYFQLKTYLVALLMKQDKMSMAASIETRVPYLDHHLVELAFSLPDNWKIAGTRGKHLLKQVSRSLLPREVIDRSKQGFPVPIARWFREPGNPFVDILLDPESLRDGFLDPAFVRGRVERFMAGEELSLELWAMLNLEIWRREFLTPASRLRAVAS
jgi:asparagine synthase (glutamine-hydrolysing)